METQGKKRIKVMHRGIRETMARKTFQQANKMEQSTPFLKKEMQTFNAYYFPNAHGMQAKCKH